MKQVKRTFTLFSMLLIGLIATAQMNETFDLPGLIGGWSSFSSTGQTWPNVNWQTSQNPSHPLNNVTEHTGNGGAMAWIKGDYQPGVSALLESPAINFTSTTNLQLSFWMLAKSDPYYGNTPNTFWIDWYDGATWHDSIFVYVDSTANNDWEKFVIDLSAYSNSGSNHRVRFGYSNTHPTHRYNHGVAIDDIVIKSVVNNDAMVASVLNPEMPTCSQDSLVKVVIKNNGFLPLVSADINWSINNVAQSTYAWTGNLAPDEFDTILLANNSNIALGSSLSFSTSLPNGTTDQNPGNDQVNIAYQAGAHGVFTVDSTNVNADFGSIQQALDAFDQYGICGNVTIQLAAGTYNGEILIDAIAGADSTTGLIIESASGNPADVVLQHEGVNSSNDYVLGVFNMHNVTIRNITVKNTSTSSSSGIKVGNIQGLQISNCVVETNGQWSGSGVHVVAGQSASTNIVIENNVINQGYKGIFIQAPYGDTAKVVTVQGNTVFNQKSVGIEVNNSGQLLVSNNEFRSLQGSGYVTAIKVFNARGAQVVKNFVKGNTLSPQVGIQVQGVKADSNFANIIANNRVAILASNGSNGILNENSEGMLVAHNSVLIGSSVSGRQAFRSGWNNSGVKLFNNAFEVRGNNAAIMVDAGQIVASDYNVFTVDTGAVVKEGYNVTYATISDWVAASGLDSNSFAITELFTNTQTLKTCNDSLHQAGTALIDVADDCDNDPRPATPTIGADEFKLAGGLQPISDFELCNNQVVTIKHPFADTMIWNGDTLTSVTVDSPGTYAVTVISTCESISYSLNVLGFNPAELTDGAVCEGSMKEISTGVSNGSYLWSTGSTDSVITIDSAATVWVKVESADGCVSTDTVDYAVVEKVLLADSMQFCQGSSVTISGNVAANYVWSDGSTSSFITVFNPGVYSVTASLDGCESSDTTFVEEVQLPVASFVDSNEVNTVYFTNTSLYADNFFWEFGDGNDSQDEHPTHTYSNPGNEVKYVTVVLHVENVCGTDTKTNFDVGIGGWPTGIKELENDLEVHVFPNPSSGLFNLTAQTSGETHIEVLTLSGQVVFAKTVYLNKGQAELVDLSNVANGAYMLNVRSDEQQAMLQIIKK